MVETLSRLTKRFAVGPRGSPVIWIVLPLLLVEVFVRVPSMWTLDPRSSVGMIPVVADLAFEEAPNPVILFMGSSLVRDSISPGIVAESMDLERSAVANVAFSGAGTHDLLWFYEARRSRLTNLETVVIGMRTAFLRPREAPTLRFRQHASLSERIAERGWRTKLDLVLGWVWKTWDAKHVLKGYATSVLYHSDEYARVDDLGRIVFHDQGQERPTEQSALKAAEGAFSSSEIDERRVGEITDLVELMVADGVQVFFLEGLNNPVVLEAARTTYQAEDRLWRSAIADATGLEVIHLPGVFELCDDWRDCYVDSVHLNAKGAAAYSKLVGEWLTTVRP